MKRILFATSEAVPFIKTGGLADVCGALPKEFSKEEWDVRVVIPNYSCIPEKYRSQFQYVTHFYMCAAVKPEIKINRDYFEQQGISFEEPEEEQPEEKTEKAAPEISVNLDSEYFKWKEQEGKEEDSEDEKQPEKKGFFGKFMK